jgi:hypothetical protein
VTLSHFGGDEGTGLADDGGTPCVLRGLAMDDSQMRERFEGMRARK